ncbi:retron St85 family RNA-directed DNA polymerase [Acinetobacter sp. G11]|uniref:retron St85 family RNA-directed DNA polymerase n=1 Tax=Acinetobacter sp. G11 TaxID=3415989 RepID=UPI003C7AB26A
MIELNLLKSLNTDFPLGEDNILSFARTAPHRYKTYEILKKDGINKRKIAQPSKEVKLLQRSAIKALEHILPIHDAAFAYVKNRSIKHNAVVHQNSNFILKTDLSNFFNSITPQILLEKITQANIKLSEKNRELITHLFFWKEQRNGTLKLSVGAPSSPFLSNFIMFNFDEKILEICKQYNCSYSRYADDITISSFENFFELNFPLIITKLLKDEFNENIKLNIKKTKYISKAYHRHVTGITLTNDQNISIGQKQKRLLSAKVHHFKNNKMDNLNDILKLKGQLSFAFYINPNLRTKFETKYGQGTIIQILKYKNS